VILYLVSVKSAWHRWIYTNFMYLEGRGRWNIIQNPRLYSTVARIFGAWSWIQRLESQCRSCPLQLTPLLYLCEQDFETIYIKNNLSMSMSSCKKNMILEILSVVLLFWPNQLYLASYINIYYPKIPQQTSVHSSRSKYDSTSIILSVATNFAMMQQKHFILKLYGFTTTRSELKTVGP